MASPARQQYLELKREHPEAILMFRLGDFYEMFDEDAEVASRILGIQLTARNYPRGEGRVPMAGVPFHSVQGYIKRLLDAGQTVALCEQLSLPGKGIVDRGVVRVFTSGTIVEPDMLKPEENNYLAAVSAGKSVLGLAFADITTGEFCVAEFPLGSGGAIEAELLRLAPAECLVGQMVEIDLPPATSRAEFSETIDAKRAAGIICRHLHVASVSSFGLDDQPAAVVASAMILTYLERTNRSALDVMTAIRAYNPGNFMTLDRFTRASLELTPRPGDNSRWTLFRVLNRTKTGMGARRLRASLGRPLLDIAEIEERLSSVQALVEAPMTIRRLEGELNSVGDLERIAGRVVQGRATSVDLNQLRTALRAAAEVGLTLTREIENFALASQIDPCEAVCVAIESAIDPSGETLVKAGYDPELDRLRGLVSDSRSAIAELERREVEQTGIKTLRVGYNKVFGYYFEVGKAAAQKMPDRFIRQQTLLNAERYITPELKTLEAAIGQAQDDSRRVELELFQGLLVDIKQSQNQILATADVVAQVDVFRSLADVAVANNYCRPQLDQSTDLAIFEGRHPVVEAADTDSAFVPNDCRFDSDTRIIILTGPNMGGKSTMLRTVAMIALMAQIGSFVPAKEARIGIVDRIFSRVGAKDDISAGQSTFMTEMIETANILHNATARSLLILDEIGRGTSTYDGLAIARAVVEYLHARVPARILFATHYHELAALESELSTVKNFHTEVADHEGRAVFLHKITRGSADRSFGIHVARLAGLPHSVTVRADRLLRQLERNANGSKPVAGPQMALFSDPDLAPRSEIEEAAVRILDQILAMDLSGTTPLEALERLHRLQDEGRVSR